MPDIDDKDKNEADKCQDKLAFDSKEQASATRIYATHRHGGKLRVYKCKQCGLWHLTSSS